ncbi:hypothetical protein CORC01_07581, partial [Colletotrichum orchidophilum]
IPIYKFSPADSTGSPFVGNYDSYRALPISRWTNVLQDNQVLTHLLHLFWTWDSTLSNIVDKGRFFADLCSDVPELTLGSQKVFCSSFLVNAILAVSALHSAKKCYVFDPNAVTLAHQFAQEACRLLEFDKNGNSLTFLQGAAILCSGCVVSLGLRKGRI